MRLPNNGVSHVEHIRTRFRRAHPLPPCAPVSAVRARFRPVHPLNAGVAPVSAVRSSGYGCILR